MFGLDERIAELAAGQALLLVLVVALLLGLRHATDPDHLAAVSTLVASDQHGSGGGAGRLGAAWGLGHALTLAVVGLPIVLTGRFLPDAVQRGAEVLVGLMIMWLATRLVLRRRAGALGRPARTRAAAFGIGLAHGAGGSAGVALLLLAAIPDRTEAVAALTVLAVGSAVSMTLLSSGFARLIEQRASLSLAPAAGLATLAFGGWYALGALGAVPYVL